MVKHISEIYGKTAVRLLCGNFMKHRSKNVISDVLHSEHCSSCEIRGCHRSADENSSLLEYDAVCIDI